MFAWMVFDYLTAAGFLALGYRLVRFPVLPRWLPPSLTWPLRAPTRRALRLQGVSALCSGACCVAMSLVLTPVGAVAGTAVALTWAGAALAWVASVWVSSQPDPEGAARP